MTDTQPSMQGFANNLDGTPQYAGFWWRFLALFIDGIILGIAVNIVTLAIKFGISVAFMAFGTTFVGILSGLAGLLIWQVSYWLYFALQESSPQQATIGKLVCKIKVTDINGGQISFMRATGRYFGKFLSGITLLAGYIMAAFTEKKQALHDILASTLVVKNPE